MKLPFSFRKGGDPLQESAHWEVSINDVRDRSERRAWQCAMGSFVICVGVLGLQFAGKPKIIEKPTVIKVDEIRGTVEVEQSLKDAKTTYSEALTKRDLRVYVRARESYSRATAEDAFTAVQLMNSEQERLRYQAFFTPSNPRSPLNVLGAEGRVKLYIKSVNFLSHNNKVATVRYAADEYSDWLASSAPKRTHWIATITFTNINPPTKESEREINPLGLQVSEYRRDPDSGDVGSEVTQ